MNSNTIAKEKNFFDLINNLNEEQISSLLEYAIQLKNEELENIN